MRNLIRFGLILTGLVLGMPIILVVMAVVGLGPGLIQSGLMSGGSLGLVLILIGAAITYGLFRMVMGVVSFVRDR